MKFYNAVGPNPRVVRMFIHEKGLEIPTQKVDLRGGENRRAPYNTEVNPAGQCPALERDNGETLTEITAICEYLEELHPTPPLIGSDPEERADARMWARRIDLNIIEPMANGFRFSEGLKLFENRIHCIPHAAEDLKAVAREKLAWLDGLLEGRRFVCGERFSLPDILLFCFLDFGRQVGQPFDPGLKMIPGWFERVGERPSAAA